MEGQLIQYLPVLILLGVAIAFAAGNLIISKLIGKRATSNATKDTPYECGMPAEGEGSSRMSVKFYLVAMLFILFDIEVVFLFPWAVVYKDMLATINVFKHDKDYQNLRNGRGILNEMIDRLIMSVSNSNYNR